MNSLREVKNLWWNKNMKELVILVGNIGSGKSTLSKQYAEKGYVIISRDALRYMIGGGKYRFDPIIEPGISAGNLSLIQIFMELGESIVIDETNLLRRIRFNYLALADQFNYKKKAVVLPYLSKEESVKRKMQNPHDTKQEKWEELWEKFDSIIEFPTVEEGFNSVEYLEK